MKTPCIIYVHVLDRLEEDRVLASGEQLIRKCIRFPLDAGKTFCYRSRVSHGAFFHNLKQRNWFPNHKPRKWTFLYTTKSAEEHQFDIEQWTRVGIGITYEYEDCVDIWDFYKRIGWDYKSKKWSRND